eukprot:223078-Pleurochrysis_carterae.AAC.3
MCYPYISTVKHRSQGCTPRLPGNDCLLVDCGTWRSAPRRPSGSARAGAGAASTEEVLRAREGGG